MAFFNEPISGFGEGDVQFSPLYLGRRRRRRFTQHSFMKDQFGDQMRIVPEENNSIISNGLLQTTSCLYRIALEKRRNVRITCCEFSSHLFLILILVTGYSLSKILHYDPALHSKFFLSIPGDTAATTSSTSSSSTSSGSNIVSNYQSLVDGPLIVPTFDEFIFVSRYLSRNVRGNAVSLLTQTTFGRSFTNL